MSPGPQANPRAITLSLSPILVVIVIVAAAVMTFHVWWRNQPTLALDINTASVGELTAVFDGMTAEQIVNGRPYERTQDLVEKKIIPQATYDKIKDQIVAKQK